MGSDRRRRNLFNTTTHKNVSKFPECSSGWLCAALRAVAGGNGVYRVDESIIRFPALDGGMQSLADVSARNAHCLLLLLLASVVYMGGRPSLDSIMIRDVSPEMICRNRFVAIQLAPLGMMR